MQYRHFGKLNLKPSVLGFGAMRMPVIDGKYDQINIDEAIRMIRYAIDNGVNYIDTAWGYHDGKSEPLVGMALKDGYREKVMLATKNPTWHIHKTEDWDYYLNEQLKRLETDHIDFYLQHALDKNGWEKFKRLGLWEKAMEAKKAGKIKYIGFSFHDEYEVFADILDTYDWDFCQIQLNYLDTDYQAGLKGLEKAASKNIGVVIMEPLRGGRLANGLPDFIIRSMEEYPVKRNPVDWALRWLANLPGVATILSGMSTFEQVEENIQLCSSPDMGPNKMSKEEVDFILDLANRWKSMKQIGCTNCKYCMPCPNGVNIPVCFSVYNYFHSTNPDAWDKGHKDYKELISNSSDAALCIECGQCEGACPQHLPIIETLKIIRNELKPKD
jgi:predicted aldo/keto reductase-like oxidoreductase